MIETKKTMCKDCCYKDFEAGNGQPNRYYCTHRLAGESVSAAARLICRTERHNAELTIKTRPRWCPLSDQE